MRHAVDKRLNWLGQSGSSNSPQHTCAQAAAVDAAIFNAARSRISELAGGFEPLAGNEGPLRPHLSLDTPRNLVIPDEVMFDHSRTWRRAATASDAAGRYEETERIDAPIGGIGQNQSQEAQLGGTYHA